MTNYYGEQCRTCLQKQAPDDMAMNEQSNFADVCWVEVVDECRMVCPRHELSGDLGHAYCLHCLLSAARKVEDWDLNLQAAREVKYNKIMAMSDAKFEQLVLPSEATEGADGLEEPPAMQNPLVQIQPEPPIQASHTFRAEAAAEQLASEFSARSANAEENIQAAQTTYNVLETALEDAVAGSDTERTGELEGQATALGQEIKAMMQADAGFSSSH